MLKSMLINVAVSLAVSTSVLLCGFVLLRQHVREEVDRAVQKREEQFVSAYRERVLKIRHDFGMPDKPVTTFEDGLEPMIMLSQ